MAESQAASAGIILACRDYAHLCGYRCCDQARPGDPDSGPANSLLLYPGEVVAATRSRRHLAIYGDPSQGASARCRSEAFDQSSCDPQRNFKPLDCESYPFFPSVVGGQLTLLKDTRCPLPRNLLLEHYLWTLQRWLELTDGREEIGAWIAGIVLDTYERFCLEDS